MNISQFMSKVNATKKTVVRWLDNDLIPDAKFNELTKEWFIPDSARRPYKAPWNIGGDADPIRASIVNACLKNQYISRETYQLSEGEFSVYIAQLIKADLIQKRVEDGIIYYDSTLESRKFIALSKSQRKKAIAKLVNSVLEASPYILTAFEGIKRLVG